MRYFILIASAALLLASCSSTGEEAEPGASTSRTRPKTADVRDRIEGRSDDSSPRDVAANPPTTVPRADRHTSSTSTEPDSGRDDTQPVDSTPPANTLANPPSKRDEIAVKNGVNTDAQQVSPNDDSTAGGGEHDPAETDPPKKVVDPLPLSFEEIVQELGRAAQDSDDIKTRMSLVGLYIDIFTATNDPKYLSASEDLLNLLQDDSRVSRQWLRLKRAAVASALGEPKEAYEALWEATFQELKSIPLEVSEVYFSTGFGDDNIPIRRTRLEPDRKTSRADAVYKPEGMVQVACKYRFLHGIQEQEGVRRYAYAIRITARLLDPDGKEVEGFIDSEVIIRADEGEAMDRLPDEYGYVIWRYTPLPHDLKLVDHTLELTFADLNRPHSTTVTKTITVKIR